jgi:RHS repeat-associated protein
VAWDIFGRRVSTWAASNHGFVESNAYTDSAPIAIRSGGTTQFEHQNWLGTERVRTSYNGAVLISINSLPWADGHTPSGDNGDQHDFALMERDLEDNTEHAQFRQYSTNLGRWQSPDLYLGSYDFSNPQSFNRYTYALNNPSSLVDPSGLKWCWASLLGFPCDYAGGGESDPTYTIYLTTWASALGSTPYDADLLSLDNPILLPTSDRVRGTTGNAPNNCTNGLGTGGVGVGAGYNADLGVGAVGASSTGGVGGGLFHNSAGGYSGGLFKSGGAAAYAGSHMAGAPSQNSSSYVLGGYAGAGANFFFTNAGGSQQLAGPFTTVSINVGYSVANLGVQLSFGGGIWSLSITPPIASVGFGAAGSVIRTNTIATHKGCH